MTPQQSSSINRRALAKGVAWSAPVIVAASAAPAYAASGCTPSIGFSGGLTYNWGNVSLPRNDQRLTAGGQTYVYGLPEGVTVTAVDYQWWIQNRNGQQTGGPGIFWVRNPTSDRSCASGGCSMAWSPTAGSGWVPRVTNTRNGVSTTYPEGQVRPSWDLNFSWRASRGPGSYTVLPGGCRQFTTGPSGRFPVNYSNVVSEPQDDNRFADDYLIITVRLSNGETLTKTSQGQLT